MQHRVTISSPAPQAAPRQAVLYSEPRPAGPPHRRRRPGASPMRSAWQRGEKAGTSVGFDRSLAACWTPCGYVTCSVVPSRLNAGLIVCFRLASGGNRPTNCGRKACDDRCPDLPRSRRWSPRAARIYLRPRPARSVADRLARPLYRPRARPCLADLDRRGRPVRQALRGARCPNRRARRQQRNVGRGHTRRYRR